MIPQLVSGGLTDVGRRRDSNQDQFLIADLNRSLRLIASSLAIDPASRIHGSVNSRLILVADGMGGHQAGAQASRQAIEVVVNQLLDCVPWVDLTHLEQLEQFSLRISKLFKDAHRSLEKTSSQNPALKGMGTTLTLALIAWPKLLVAHAGDSRCYLYRTGQLTALTQDHTVANQLVSRGELRAQDAAKSPWGNMLWNVIGGGGSEVHPAIRSLDLKADDTLLLCSDGLNKHLSDDDIAEVLSLEGDPIHLCQQLIDIANQRGGSDNVTVVLTRIEMPSNRPTPATASNTHCADNSPPTTDVIDLTTTVDSSLNT